MENLENNNSTNQEPLNNGPLNLSDVQADEEDLTVIQESGIDVLKFKDRKSDPEGVSGMGYKVLRKSRIIEGIGCATMVEISSLPKNTGEVTIRLNGITNNLYVSAGSYHRNRLVVKQGCKTAGTITVGMGGYDQNFNVNPVDHGTPEKLASFLADKYFKYYTQVLNGKEITFTSDEMKFMWDGYFVAGNTGVLIEYVRLSQGEAPDTLEGIVKKLYALDFEGYDKNISGNIVTWKKFTTVAPAATVISVASTELGISFFDQNIPKSICPLLQEHFADTDTIYEIRYNFHLNGGKLSLPKNAQLRFNGGSIDGGMLVGNGTQIEGHLQKIFGPDLALEGNWQVPVIYPEWFGAESLKMRTEGDIDAVSPASLNPSAEVLGLKDSADAINKAIRFSVFSGGLVKLLGHAYKINKTLEVLERTTVLTDIKTILFIQLLGTGDQITTHNPTDSSFSNENLKSPIKSLLPNQFLRTDCMKIGINISSVGAKLIGGGTISLVLSNYTVGIYMKGTGYRMLDMSTGSQVDVKTVGGGSTWTKDVVDLFGNGAPKDQASSIDNVFYADYLNNNMYRSTSGKWELAGKLTIMFNISIRFEVFEGWNSGRIIDPDIHVSDMYGWRGIEIITRTGGWFNEATYKGTISNKDGSYISIFTDYDVINHDFSNVIIQTDARMGGDARIFQAIRAGSVKLGTVWDLSWVASPRVTCAFYLGQFTKFCYLSTIDSYKFLIDQGQNNSYGILPNKNNIDIVAYSQYVNILQYATPFLVTYSGKHELFYVEFDRIMSLDQMKGIVKSLPENTFRDSAPKQLFDEQPNTKHRIIDTANNKFGCAIDLSLRATEYGLFFYFKKNAFVLIEYIFNEGMAFPVGDYGVVLYAIDTMRDDYSGETLFRYSLRQHENNNGINRLYIPVGGGTQSRIKLFMMCLKEVDNLKVDIVNIKLLTDNPMAIDNYYNNKCGISTQRPDASPKGHIFEDITLGKTLINRGNSLVQRWMELPVEESGDWPIAMGTSIVAATAYYSKIGKQVYLAGQLSFAANYSSNTNVPITLPFAPNYGGIYTIGDLIFTLSNNSTTALVKSLASGINKTFQLNFMTA